MSHNLRLPENGIANSWFFDSLRKEIVQLQIKRDEARRNLEEQSTTGALEVCSAQIIF